MGGQVLMWAQMAKDWARQNTEYVVVGGCESGISYFGCGDMEC